MKNKVKLCACGCGKPIRIAKFPSQQRRFISGHNSKIQKEMFINKTVLKKLYTNRKRATLISVAKKLNVSVQVVRKNIIRNGLAFKTLGFRLKGRTYESIVGIAKAKELKKLRAIVFKKVTSGKIPWNKDTKGLTVPWNKGLTADTSLLVKKYTEKATKTRKKNGCIPWNKNLTIEDPRVARNVAKSFPKLREYFRTHSPSIYSGRSKHGFRTDLGHYVRSRWEANICRLLNRFQIDYFYEPKVFYFEKEDRSYTPDIFIPIWNCWVEIISFKFKEHEEKIELIKKYYPEYTTFKIFPRLYHWLQNRYYNKELHWEFARISKKKLMNNPKSRLKKYFLTKNYV